jgi:hypothetical protein
LHITVKHVADSQKRNYTENIESVREDKQDRYQVLIGLYTCRGTCKIYVAKAYGIHAMHTYMHA